MAKRPILGDALGDTGWLLRQEWARIVCLSLLILGPMNLLGVWLQLHNQGRPFSVASIAIQMISSWLIEIPVLSLYIAGLAWSLSRRLAGERPSLVAMGRMALRRWPAMVGVQLLVGLVTSLGMVLLVAPGLILASRWAMTAQVVAIEGGGLRNALARSAYLTQGRRRLTCGVFLAQALGYYVVYYSIQLPLAALIGPPLRTPLAMAINAYGFSTIYGALYMALMVVFYTAFFRRLVAARAPSADVTAEVFA